MEKYLLSIDVGTTAVKVAIFNDSLMIIALSIQEYELLTLDEGFIELSAETYWNKVTSGIHEVLKILKDLRLSKSDIKVITCTTQGETLIPVDAQGNVLHNAIVWLDGRAVKEAEFINRGFSIQEIYSITGLAGITPFCPVSKFLWIKNNMPDIYNKIDKLLLLEDYIIFKLTGKYVTNISLMCSTGYFDISRNELWNGIIQYCGLDKSKIPEIMECGKTVGSLLNNAALVLDLSENVMVSTGAMDQAASAVGAGNIVEGIVSETTGTALAVVAVCDTPDFNNPFKVNICSHAIYGKFLLMPYSQTAGIILKWFKNEFCEDIVLRSEISKKDIYKEMDLLASQVEPLSNGLILFPHFTGMQLPEMNPHTRGVFFGVGLNTGRKHFIRSILESVGYMLRESIEAIQSMGVKALDVYSLGGGSKSRLWLQIKADINDMTFNTMEHEETASVGAAILGGMSIGIFKSVEEACRLLKVKNTIIPNKKNVALYDKAYRKYKEIYKISKQIFD